MSRLAVGPVFVALLVGTLPAGRSVRAAEAKPAVAPDYSGHWVYNVSLSDDARQKMREARSGSGSGGGSGGGGYGGGHGGGMGGGYGGRGGGYGGGVGGGYGGGHGGHGGGRSGSSATGDSVPSEARTGSRSVIDPPLELSIAQTQAEFDVDDMLGKVRKLYPDGKKYKTDEGDTEVKASWHDGKLQVETRNNHGGTVNETWERVPDGSRLIVNLKIEGGFGKVELKRIYDREAPEAKAAP